MPTDRQKSAEVFDTSMDTPGPESDYAQAYSRARESGGFGDYATAADEFAMAAAVARDFGEQDERLMDSLSRLAYCHYRLGALQEAEQAYREALSLMEKFHKSKHPDRFASILWALAVLLCDNKRYDESEEYFLRSMAVSESWSGPNDRFVADCLWGLSKCLTGAGKFDQAESAILQAISIYESLSGSENVDEFLCTNYNNLGTLLLQRGKLEGSIKYIKKAIKLRQRMAGQYDPGLISLTSKISLALMQIKDYEAARRYLKQGLKVTAAIYGEESIDASRKMIALANCLTITNNCEQAQKYLQKARTILQNQEEEADSTLLTACLFELANCHQKLNQQAKLKDTLEAISDRYEKNRCLARGSMYADAMIKLAEMHSDQCRYKKARQLLQGALETRQSLYGREHKSVAECLLRLGNVESRMSLAAEAEEHIRTAEKMLADLKKRA